jgi:hypothetical protein
VTEKPTVPQPIGPQFPGTRQLVLGLELPPDASKTRVAIESVMLPFYPLGLLLWGVTRETRVHRIQVGNTLEVAAGLSSIPGEYFAQGHTFETIVALAEQGELDINLASRQILEMRTAEPGVHLRLELSGPCDSACFWGRTYVEGHPFERALIERADDGAYRGRIDRFKLSGIETVAEAVAPTAESTATLLAGFAQAARSYRV